MSLDGIYPNWEILVPRRPDRSARPDACASSVTHACRNAASRFFLLTPSSHSVSSDATPPSRTHRCPRALLPLNPLLSPHGQDPRAETRTTRRAHPVYTTLGALRTSTTGPNMPPPTGPGSSCPISHSIQAVPHDSLPLKYETLRCNIRLKQIKHLEHTLETCV
jgi:hypothetical protein